MSKEANSNNGTGAETSSQSSLGWGFSESSQRKETIDKEVGRAVRSAGAWSRQDDEEGRTEEGDEILVGSDDDDSGEGSEGASLNEGGTGSSGLAPGEGFSSLMDGFSLSPVPELSSNPWSTGPAGATAFPSGPATASPSGSSSASLSAAAPPTGRVAGSALPHVKKPTLRTSIHSVATGSLAAAASPAIKASGGSSATPATTTTTTTSVSASTRVNGGVYSAQSLGNVADFGFFAPVKRDDAGNAVPEEAPRILAFQNAATAAAAAELADLTVAAAQHSDVIDNPDQVRDIILDTYRKKAVDLSMTTHEAQKLSVLGLNESVLNNLSNGTQQLEHRVVYAQKFWKTMIFRKELMAVAYTLEYNGVDLGPTISALKNLKMEVLMTLILIGMRTSNPSKFFKSVRNRNLEAAINQVQIQSSGSGSTNSVTMSRIMRVLCEFSGAVIGAWLSDPNIDLPVPDQNGLTRIERVALLSSAPRFFDESVIANADMKMFILACQFCRSFLYSKPKERYVLTMDKVHSYFLLSESETKVIRLVLTGDYKGRWKKLIYDFMDSGSFTHYLFANKSAKSKVRAKLDKGDFDYSTKAEAVDKFAKAAVEREEKIRKAHSKIIIEKLQQSINAKVASGIDIEDLI